MIVIYLLVWRLCSLSLSMSDLSEENSADVYKQLIIFCTVMHMHAYRKMDLSETLALLRRIGFPSGH